MNVPRPIPANPYAQPNEAVRPSEHARSSVAPAPSEVLTRSYEVSWLAGDGRARYDTVKAPSHPVIDAACANVARGALVATADGPVAVEDLQPGAKIMTSEYGPVTLQWIGSYTLTARDLQQANRSPLMRVMTEAFGLAKPSADLILSPRTHVLMRHPACNAMFGMDLAYAPIHAFEDGMQVISLTPLSPVTLYNLAFDRQATISVNSVEVESFHPGPFMAALRDNELKYAVLRLFPQVQTLEDFGTELTKRLTSNEAQRLRDGG